MVCCLSAFHCGWLCHWIGWWLFILCLWFYDLLYLIILDWLSYFVVFRFPAFLVHLVSIVVYVHWFLVCFYYGFLFFIFRFGYFLHSWFRFLSLFCICLVLCFVLLPSSFWLGWFLLWLCSFVGFDNCRLFSFRCFCSWILCSLLVQLFRCYCICLLVFSVRFLVVSFQVCFCLWPFFWFLWLFELLIQRFFLLILVVLRFRCLVILFVLFLLFTIILLCVLFLLRLFFVF